MRRALLGSLLLLSMLLVSILPAGKAEAQPFVPKTSGATLKTVSVTASNAAVQACAAVVDGCTVQVPSDAAVGIRLILVNAGTACSAITVKLWHLPGSWLWLCV